MKKQKVHTYRSETLFLQPLRLVLADARKDLPPRVSKKDRNEELALKLIEKMRKKFRKPVPIIN